MDSLILSTAQKHSLIALTGLKDKTFSLLWRGTRDGFEAKTFNRLCDGQGKTLLVIKNTEGWIFGGFTSVTWSSPSEDEFKTDSTVFLFTLTNPSAKPLKLEVTRQKKAVWHCSSQGPIFGTGPDLIVLDESNADRDSYMYLDSYEYPNGLSEAEGGQFIVGGEDNKFQTSEVEVFKVF